MKFGKLINGVLVPGALAAALMAGTSVATPVSAQAVSCGERQMMLNTLKNRYQESRTAYGITVDGRLLEIFSGLSGSWTLLMTQPGGKSCLMSSGKGWRHIIEEKPTDPVA